MSNVYFSRDYIPKRRNTFQRKEINQQEETKESIIRDIENNRRSNSASSNNNYKSGFLIMCGALVVVCIWGIYTIGYKSGKRKYKYKRCK